MATYNAKTLTLIDQNGNAYVIDSLPAFGAKPYSETYPWKNGEYCSKDGKVYKFISTDLSSGEVWDSTHWENVKLADEIQGIFNRFDNLNLGEVATQDVVPITNGGTGATTAPDARTALGLSEVATQDVVPITNGGTGATTAPDARTALGLSEVATQDVVPITNGGTGATSVLDARTALGLSEVATQDVIPVENGGTGQTTLALARNAMGLGNTTGALPVANGGTGATNAANARTALGLGSAATVSVPISPGNGGTGQTTLALARNAMGLGNTTGALPVTNGGTGATNAANARTALGLGSAATVSVPITPGNGGTGQTTLALARNAMGLGNTTGALPPANGGTGQTTLALARNAMGLGNTTGAVPVPNGGTGATNAANARTNLGLGSAATVSVPITPGNGGTGQTTLALARNAMGLGNTTGALPVTNGGTGATNAANARTALGVPADSAVVHNTGDETISGLKIFTTNPTIRNSSTSPSFAFRASGLSSSTAYLYASGIGTTANKYAAGQYRFRIYSPKSDGSASSGYYESFDLPVVNTGRTASASYTIWTSKKFAIPLTPGNGGTGQTTLALARNAMGLGNTTGALPVTNGGTGATNAANARTALGAQATIGIDTPTAVTGKGVTCYIRRYGRIVNLLITGTLNAATTSGTAILTVPAGYRPIQSQEIFYGASRNWASGMVALYVESGGSLKCKSALESGGLYGSVTYICGE